MSKSTKLVLFCATVAMLLILLNSGIVTKTFGPLGEPSIFPKELSEDQIDALPKSKFR